MTKASDNAFPSFLVTEGTAPASPAAGKQRVYIDSADHHLKRKNSGGTVTDLEGGTAAAYVTASVVAGILLSVAGIRLANRF